MFANEYFDPDMKRFISVEDMWDRNLKNVLRCAADVKRRLDDLKELQEAVRQTLSVLSIREQNSIKCIQDATETVIAQLRRRELEVIGQVSHDTLSQREKLDQIYARIEEHSSTLRREVQIMMNTGIAASQENPADDDGSSTTGRTTSIKQRFAALTACEKTLSDSCFYSIPDAFSCQVITKPLTIDHFINATKVKCVSLIPSTLTIVAKENKFYCPLPSATSYIAGGAAASTRDHHHSGGASVISSHTPAGASSLVGEATLRGNTGGLPLGILHYLATQGGRTAFKSVIEEDLVRVSCSIPIQVGSISNLLYDRNVVCGVIVSIFSPRSASHCQRCSKLLRGREGILHPMPRRTSKKKRIVFDFSDRRRIRLEAYILQHGHKEEHAALRNWAIEGSNDGVDWLTLDRQYESRLLGQKPFNEASFVVSSLAFSRRGLQAIASVAVNSEGKGGHLAPNAEEDIPAFRYLSLVSCGPNAAGDPLHHIELGRIEFFGTVVVG
ncbi:Hypothetical protein, putative [Bodo saltans]|uniref:F5/8 type C domain-containing protein n=1 Tax=Bodo saltans TaxID=75058 RepID=A0A0S4JM36_BODSA|nr:Hypothetical protein, putative [Bodo saltans]|eukprot:CUG92595.1 Hypothetical protein, putative [Bodo saltans]